MNTTKTEYTQKTSFNELVSYLREVIYYRLKKDFSDEEVPFPLFDDFTNNESEFTNFIKEYKLNKNEILVVLIALVPNLTPNFFSDIISDFFPNGGEFPNFGGVKGKNHRGILPTGETILYILAGENLSSRSKLIDFLWHKSSLFSKGIIELERVPYGEPFLSGKIILNQEFVHLFLTGKELLPQLSQEFPASLITTKLNWEDLVLSPKTFDEVKEIENWLAYNEILLNDWGMKSKIKPGYRVLFCGLPGTGKTLTASLLGKFTNKQVYRVDLSMVVSKYIGETEKNLSKLFDKSMNRDWILFFDEADSIFGKRTSVRDAHDKYANQEVSYLLQRIEAHPGLIILASNFKNNIDAAFTRRFHNIIEFETPSYEERVLLWKNNLPSQVDLDGSISVEKVAKAFNMTGANIVNVVQFACLKTLANKQQIIHRDSILEGIKREYAKEGKTISVSI